LKDDLARGAALEKRDSSYAKFAAAAKQQAQELAVELEQAKDMLAFRKGPIEALAQGMAQAQAAARAKGLEAQRDAWAQAVAKFQTCRSQSADMIGDHPKIAPVEFTTGEGRMPAKNVITLCSEQDEAATQNLGHVNAILAVYDGPAKSFEQAKTILARADKAKDQERKSALTEALVHLESCLEKGKILQYKHPKLAEMQFDIAGAKLTLSAVVSDCQQRAKAIREDINRPKS